MTEKFCNKHEGVLRPLRKSGYGKCPKCNTEAVQRRRRKVKVMAVAYKGGKCEKCGYSKCNAALAFHHLDPMLKDFNIGYKGYTASWKRITAELDKCILVCHNCHSEIHAEELDL